MSEVPKLATDPELLDLLAKARAHWDAMTPEAKEAELKIQREGIAKAEASWPKAKFKMVDGVKVYDSYEDYLND